MRSGTVFKKAAAMAAASPGNISAGAGAAVASAVTLNPLPLVLWGLGSAAWVLLAASSPRYTRRVLDRERLAAEREADQGRRAMAVKIEAALAAYTSAVVEQIEDSEKLLRGLEPLPPP